MSTRGTGSKPDLVDQAALAERLGVTPATASRWHRRSILPPPDLRVGTTELWLWETVHGWAGKRSRSLRKPKPSRTVVPVDVVDLAGLAERLGVPPRTAAGWQYRGLLPEPDYRWEAGDGWLWSTIDRWARVNAGRVPGLFRTEGQVASPEREPRGPRLAPPHNQPPVPAPPATPVTVTTPSNGASAVAGIRPVARPVAPAPEPVVTRKRSPDPIGDMGRIRRYFAGVAEAMRLPEV